MTRLAVVSFLVKFMYPLIEIFGRTVGTYAIMGAIGLFAAVFAAIRLAKRFGIGFEDIVLLTVSVGVGLFIGAHLLFGVTNYRYVFEAFRTLGDVDFSVTLDILRFAFGGMVYYGGLLGALIAAAIHVKVSKTLKKGEVFDILAVVIPLFHTFGRIGCFLGGCCYGAESSFGFIVHQNIVNPAIVGVRRLPIQLIESGCNFLLFLVLLFLFRKKRLPGRLIYVYLAVYSVVRFILEFFRGDSIRGLWFGLSTSQWVSIGIFIFVAIRVAIMIIKKQKKNDCWG